MTMQNFYNIVESVSFEITAVAIFAVAYSKHTNSLHYRKYSSGSCNCSKMVYYPLEKMFF